MKNESKSTSGNAKEIEQGTSSIYNQHVWFAFALVELLAEGEPVSVRQLAEKGGWSYEDVREALDQHPAVEYDDQGRINGFGLSLNPTPNRFDFDGRTVYGWCASDALAFPFLLGKSGIVTSVCPVTKKPIVIRLTPDAVVEVDPPEAVVSLVRPAQRVKDIRSDICGAGMFFSSRGAATGWLAAHPEGSVHTVSDDFEVTREVMSRVREALGV